MIKLNGNEIWRGGEKIGWLDGHHICDRGGKRLGYFEDKFVFHEDGHKLAVIQEDFLVPYGAADTDMDKVRLGKIAEDVTGGVIPELARAAIYILLGS